MNNSTTGKKVLSNFIWRFAERSGARFVAFVVSVVLARILDPDHYGIIALISVFVSILQVFIDSGLGSALIQKKDADNIDFSTVFYTNVVFCTVLYLLLFVCSPLISDFYKMDGLTPVIRVLGLKLIISGVKNVQQAYVSRKMIFKRFFFATLGGTLGSAVVGIIMAYNGFGVWALVAQELFNNTVDTLILWITVKWRPQLVFSFKRLKRLYSYSWKLLCSSLINTIYNDVRQLIIGRMYTSEALAFYNRGKKMPNLIVTNINSSIDSVLFPVMSSAQDSKEKVKKMMRTSIRVSSMIMWPVMLGMATVSEPLVRLLLTEKWMGCVPLMRVFCIALAFQPIHTSNLNALKAMGRSDLYLKMEIIKKSIGMIILLATMNFGVMVICYGVLFYNIIAQIINSSPNRKLLNYSYFEQLKDISQFIVMSLVMCVPIYFINFIHMNDVLRLIIQIIIGMTIYVSEATIFKVDAFYFAIDNLNGIIHINDRWNSLKEKIKRK